MCAVYCRGTGNSGEKNTGSSPKIHVQGHKCADHDKMQDVHKMSIKKQPGVICSTADWNCLCHGGMCDALDCHGCAAHVTPCNRGLLTSVQIGLNSCRQSTVMRHQFTFIRYTCTRLQQIIRRQRHSSHSLPLLCEQCNAAREPAAQHVHPSIQAITHAVKASIGAKGQNEYNFVFILAAMQLLACPQAAQVLPRPHW
jgi:hypothetical protein